MAQSNTSTFLCADTLINTMLFLQPRSIVKCSAISQQFYKCSKSNILWKAIYEQLFMENLFGWRLQMAIAGDDKEKDESSESDDDDSDDDSDEDDDSECDDDSDEKRRRMKRKKTKKEKVVKKPKIESPIIVIPQSEQDDMYWFNVFRETLSFPTLDMNFTKIKADADDSMDSIRKITDVGRLYDIIDYLKSSNDEENLVDAFQYNYERAPKVEKVQERLLKLAVILTVLYNGYNFSYWKDSVVISFKQSKEKKIKKKKKKNGKEEKVKETKPVIPKFICPLTTFCMLILYPKAQQNLPFEKSPKELFVAPYIKSESSKKLNEDSDDSDDDDQQAIHEKDCCFFNAMDDELEDNSSMEITYRNEDTSTSGFEWCPAFFNAGGSTFFSKIHCYRERKEKKIIVKKFESESYY